MSLLESFAAACKLAGPLEIRAVNRASGATLEFTLPRPCALIGRAGPMNVRLDDPTVSRCHAYLQVVDGVPYCIDLGSRTGVVWDDGSQGRGWVRPGHTLRVGVFDVQVGRPGADPDAEPPDEPLDAGHSRDAPPAAVLEIRGAGHHPLDRPITLIGRHPTCDLRFLDDAVSYFHCALVNTPDGAWFIDILNRQGSLLNGRPAGLARLCAGDLIELGKVSILVKSWSPLPQSGHTLVLTGDPGPAPAVTEVTAAVPRPATESVTEAFTPIREVMEHFQQCFLTMARMFATVQQEQAAMMGEQMRQVQELTKELRDLRGDAKGVVPAPPAAQPAEPSPSPPAPAFPLGFDELRDLIGGKSGPSTRLPRR
ncbi:MAG: odhI 2 [Gemmataceae bacterium]|nr:odhI 2 [Gemmataceae bacterium]